MRTLITLLVIIFIFLFPACASIQPAAQTAVTTDMPENEDVFNFQYGSADGDMLDDYQAVLDTHCPEVRRDLQFTGSTHYTVEIFPDQKAYDASLADKSVAGSPACSGDGKISLVSPRSPIRVSGITYDQRLMMAVHEYAHLLVNEINPDAPIWLAEGIACYEGSDGIYIEKGGTVAKALPAIAFTAIQDDYYDTPAADVYSFLAVKYIIDTYGLDKLNRLLRNTGDIEGILGVGISDFEKQWMGFVQSYAK